MNGTQLQVHLREDLRMWDAMDEDQREHFVKHVRHSLARKLAEEMVKMGAVEFSSSKRIADAGYPTIQLSAYVVVGGTRTVWEVAPWSIVWREWLRQLRVRIGL